MLGDLAQLGDFISCCKCIIFINFKRQAIKRLFNYS